MNFSCGGGDFSSKDDYKDDWRLVDLLLDDIGRIESAHSPQNIDEIG